MTTVQKKAKLKKLLDKERDPGILELVEKVLERETKAVNFQSDLVKRVLRSEEDLKAGRHHDWDTVSKEMDELIDSLYPAKTNTKTRRSRKTSAVKK